MRFNGFVNRPWASQASRSGALLLLLLVVLLLLVSCGPTTPSRSRRHGRHGEQPPRPVDAWAGAPGPGHAVISAFLLEPAVGPGGQAIRIANPSAVPFDLAGSSISDELGTRSKEVRSRGSRGRRDLLFPDGTPATRLAPGQEVWVARDAAEFYKEFGLLPDFEVDDDSRFPANDPAVPDVIFLGPRSSKGSWLSLSAKGTGVIALFGPDRFPGWPSALDVVPYNFRGAGKADPGQPDQQRLRRYEQQVGLGEGTLWRGPPLMTTGNLFLPSPPFSSRGRLFARDRDEQGRLLPDSDSAADWDAGASTSRLGRDPVHRVWYAGQSSFSFVRHEEPALVLATAAPESNFASLIQAFDQAKESIRIHVYYFTSTEIADALVRAIERGVDVTLAMEGGVVGTRNGFSDAERAIAQRIEQAGRERSGRKSNGLGRVYWLRSDATAGIEDRYTYDHSKYAIIDERRIIIGSENYGPTGHPVSSTYGNRGWEVQIATPEGRPPLGVVQDLLAVWNDDVDPEHHRDIVRYSEDPATLDGNGRGRYGPPPPGTTLGPTQKFGRYVPTEPAAQTFTGTIGFELVVSPDNSLSEHGAILGAIARAQHTVLVQHLSLYTHWGGRRTGSVERTPNLLLQALIEAAKRGVVVRILLSSRGTACDRLDSRWESSRLDNDDVYELVNNLARRTGLDIEARLLDTTSDDWLDDPEDHGVEKIHNKGMIIDGRVTLFASINGVENSFKGNREVGVLVDSPEVARFYERLFRYDWTTVLSPEGLEALPVRKTVTAAELARDPVHTGIVLTGLAPSTHYYVRVSAFDSDDTDQENTIPPLPLGPHESVLSDELAALSSPQGTLALRWQRNTSECLEGDLAGYRVYYGRKAAPSLPGLVTPKLVQKLQQYDGQEAAQGKSPISVPAGPDKPQCEALLRRQAEVEPPLLPECRTLLQKVEGCLDQASDVFPELQAALRRHGPPGSERWARRMATLGRACSMPPTDSATYWEQERRTCSAANTCADLLTCLRQVEQVRHRQILQQVPVTGPPPFDRAEAFGDEGDD